MQGIRVGTNTIYQVSTILHNFSGEIYELKGELNSDKKERKKEAVKKVIASMTVGKDVRLAKYDHI